MLLGLPWSVSSNPSYSRGFMLWAARGRLKSLGWPCARGAHDRVFRWHCCHEGDAWTLNLLSAGAFAGPLYWLLMAGLLMAGNGLLAGGLALLKRGSMGRDAEQSCGITQADSQHAMGPNTTLLGPKLGPQAVSLPDFLLDLGLFIDRICFSAGIVPCTVPSGQYGSCLLLVLTVSSFVACCERL